MKINYIDNAKQSEFKASKEKVTVKVSDIFLKEKIHLSAKVDFSDLAERLRNKNVTELSNVLVVKAENNNTYSLISGYKGYTLAKLLNIEHINVIIVNISRREYISQLKADKTIIDIDDIKIKKNFKYVSTEKVNNAKEYFMQHNKFDNPIVLDFKGILLDGYSRYIAAKELGLKQVEVSIC